MSSSKNASWQCRCGSVSLVRAAVNERDRFVGVATVSRDDLRSASRRQQVVAQPLSELRLAGRKSALRRRTVVQLLPVVGNVGIGGVADDVIVEEDEQETVALRVDLVDEQPPKLDRAPGSRRRSDSAPGSVLYPGESP